MRKNIINFIILITLSIFFYSCASTEIEGFQKPETNFYEYKNVCVYGNIENVKYRKTLENDISNQFNKQNITVVKSIDLFPPLKEYSSEEILQLVSKTNSEIFIEVKVLSVTTNNGDSSSFFMPVGGMFFGSGSTEIKVNLTFDIVIYDIKNNFEIIYKGTATSKEEDDEFEDCIKNIFESFAEQLVKQYFTLPEVITN